MSSTNLSTTTNMSGRTTRPPRRPADCSIPINRTVVEKNPKKFIMAETIRVPDGLYGVAVTETSISKSAADGTLTYRGYHIGELFDKASFEECVFLILEGKLPTKNELDGLASSLRSRAKAPKTIAALVRDLPTDAHPMDVLRTAVSALGATERALSPKEQQLSLIA